MTESIELPPQGDGSAQPGEGPLALRIERLRALRSAFAALAPSALNEEGRALSHAGRELTGSLTEAQRAPSPLAPSALARLDEDLERFERSMRTLARSLPVAQLRSTLPGRLARERGSVLDLLDLLLGGTLDEHGQWADRIGTLDYLITLLCTHGARRTGGVAHDPVALTPRLAAMCARADEVCDARVDEAETDFFAASGMDRESLREEFQRRTLRQRKVELGPLFFASRILRAIVTYNAALLERVTDEIQDAGDWGRFEGDDGSLDGTAAEPVSVFASTHLRRLAAAARERVRGGPASDSQEARIVAALDLDALEPSEREALAGLAVGTPDDPIGTAILIGVLCRSLAVLSVDLQRFGLSPDDVSDVWVPELDRAFERRIDEKREKDAYKQACALAELRNKFLLEPLAERLREEHGGGLPPRATTLPPTASVAPRESSAASAAATSSAATATSTRSPMSSAAVPSEPARAGASSLPPSVKAPEAAPSSPGTMARTQPAPPPTRAERIAARAKSAGSPANARRGSARDLVREALEEDRRGRRRGDSTTGSTGFPVARILQAALVVLALALAGHLYFSSADRDLHAFSREQLGIVSPHLVEGHRNGRGHGPGFVGTLDESWESLAPDERRDAAEQLVSRLRESGLDQVMIYGRDRALRIQAVGAQPVRAL
ncbi:MAG: hypothetical protein IPK00_19075 [Deltaproteobacteria bacterium]|nr:hypothetical protein [Deltaproteobacteria bacterium]